MDAEKRDRLRGGAICIPNNPSFSSAPCNVCEACNGQKRFASSSATSTLQGSAK